MAWQDGRHSRPQRYPGMSLLVHNDVRADDGNLYILRQRTSSPDGAWDLDSFRQEKPR